MLECKSEVPYVITLERELSQMPLKMRFFDVKQVREGGLQYFYAVIANFRHSKTDRIKAPVVKVSFTPPLQPMAATVCLSNGGYFDKVSFPF